jgi:hypothetical protein
MWRDKPGAEDVASIVTSPLGGRFTATRSLVEEKGVISNPFSDEEAKCHYGVDVSHAFTT